METGRPSPAGVRRLLGGGVVVLVAGCVWAGWSVSRGGLQPQDVSGVLGLPVGILGILVGAAVSLGALRLQQATDARAAALDSLAGAVREIEVAERAHMLGGGAHLIDLRVEVTPRQGGTEPPGPQRLSDVAAWYCAAPGRLVVTGAPGAGKTVFAVHLVVRLLAARGPADPVPVRLAIGDLPAPRTHRRWWGRWRTVGGFERWLTDSLVKVYGLREGTAADLVARRLVIPVLDGLDEMDAEVTGPEPGRAQRALDELNAYESVDGSAPVVLTCRAQRYTELSERYAWLRQSALLRIAGVDVEEARSYVEKRSDGRGSPLDALLDGAGEAVAQALSSPFYLGLAYAVYGEAAQGQAQPLAHLATADEVREHLLAHYIPAATRAANTAAQRARQRVVATESPWGRQAEYEPARVHQWLHHMAGEEGKLSSIGEALGLVSARALGGAVMALALGAAFLWGRSVEGLFPARWWDHQHGVVVSTVVAGAVGVLAGALFVAAVTDALTFAPSERVRGSRPGLGRRLWQVTTLWGDIASWALLLPVLLVVGAASPVVGWLAWVPEPASYVVGAVVCFGVCVALAASENTVAHVDGRSLAGCVLLPLLGWSLGFVMEEVHGRPGHIASLVGFWIVGAFLADSTKATGFALVTGFGMCLATTVPESIGPDGGAWGGAAVGFIAYCVLGCLFLGSGSAERTWRGVRRAGRVLRLPGWLSLVVVPYAVGVAGEGLLGFAGVVGVAVVWVAMSAAVLLDVLLLWLAAALLGRVPARVDAFTTWAYHAGLLRIVGGDYQFRHSELHAWLVRNPRAPRP
ncbi:hypothetical protein [Streptomyces sp. NPDC047071]|uniref:hypothetical protein n=1 Tax=Streptomyces sp. NPDC047071 TaxID=3154808 RepID=UPI00345738ED